MYICLYVYRPPIMHTYGQRQEEKVQLVILGMNPATSWARSTISSIHFISFTLCNWLNIIFFSYLVQGINSFS